MLRELATAVQEGTVSPTELVEESLRRIEASHADLNAVVRLHAEEALEAARDHPRTGPLAGLPLLVKDMARCAGSPTTFGSPLFADAPPDTRTWYNEDPRRVLSIHWGRADGEISPETVLAARREWGRALFPGDEIDGGLPGEPVAGASDTAAAVEPDTVEGGDEASGAAPPVQASSTRLGGIPAIRLQGTWSNPTDLTGGLFLTYGLECGDRLVLLDGNLYAPDREKYAYLLQFERIFESFRCGSRS